MKNGRYEFDITRLKLAHQACYEKFKKCVEKGENVIIDNTNLKFEDIKKYIDFLVLNNNINKHRYSVDICEVTFNSIEDAIKHRTDNEIGKNIPVQQMYNMYRAFIGINAKSLMYTNYSNKIEFVFPREIINPNFFEGMYILDKTKQDAVICDLDGTLSLFKFPNGTSLRNPFDASKADCDIINVAVARAISAMDT